MMKNINELLEKYWNAETTLQEEAEIRNYFKSNVIAEEHKSFQPLFSSLSHLSYMTSDVDVAEVLADANAKEMNATDQDAGAKVISLKRYIPAIAAIFLALLAAVVLFNQFDDGLSSNDNIVVLEDESDQEEAIRVTNEALALLSRNYNKGASAIKKVKHIDHVNIFHTN